MNQTSPQLKNQKIQQLEKEHENIDMIPWDHIQQPKKNKQSEIIMQVEKEQKPNKKIHNNKINKKFKPPDYLQERYQPLVIHLEHTERIKNDIYEIN